MNLPTKITISRIVATTLTFIAVVVLDIVSVINKDFTTPYLTLGSVKIDVVFLILLVLFIFTSLTDCLDGKIARKTNQVTTLGKFLDPVADKLLVNFMILFLAGYSIVAKYNVVQNVSINLWCAILMILRDIVVEALRFIAASKKVVIAANIFGKAKTVLQMVAIGVVLANDFPFAYFDSTFVNGLRISDILVYVATFMSVLSGIIYIVQNKNVLKENKND